MEASISSLSKLSLVEGKQLNTTWTASWGVLRSFLLITKEIFYVLRYDHKNFMNVLLQYYLHIFLHWPSQLQEEARKGSKDLV